MSASSYSPGQKVELNDGRSATIRFVGSTSFQTGEWVGVELEEPSGKNDGSVKGERYFQCEPSYGMFLRPAGIRQVLKDVKPTAAPKTVGSGAPGKSRPAGGSVSGVNGTKRQSVVAASGSRGSAAAGSPTPSARPGLRSPTKQVGSNGVSSASTSRTNTPPVTKRLSTSTTTVKPRPSLQAPGTAAGRRPAITPSASTATSQRASRPSLAPPSSATRAAAARNGIGVPSTRARPITPSTKQRLSSTNEEATSEEGSERPNFLSPKESGQSSQASRSEVNGEQASVSEANGEQEDEDDTIRPSFAPPAPPPIPSEPPPQASPNFSRPRRPSSPAAASIHSQRTIRSTAASNRQIEELEAKLRLLERKRLEDRDAKKNLEQARQERDQYKGIIEKLQTKYRPQQQEVAQLKQALGEAEKKLADLETTQAEHDSVMEMATLDREMAEETAEGLKTELEALRAHTEEVQLELDILREENDELTKEMSPEERESAGWVQLQQSNDRLRNALLALRDRSLDEKEELKDQIQGLAEQVKDLDSLRSTHGEVREKLLRSEADTEDLRQQLEVALQAEEMIEELTERNGRLESSVDEMRAAIDDLENLKELNDELEINHIEAEKQMQEEIDFKDSLLIDRERTAKLQQEALDSKDDTIRQFRTLVGNLQADMADMKASKQLSETEAKDLEDKSRAMLDLNLKLQNSAAKTQVKAIDLELRKLEAQEASEHLDIVRLFLPEAFHAERDSVAALLRFKRIEFKAELVHGFIKERVASFGTRGEDEDVFAECDALDKLTWIAAMARRFVNAACSCSADDFASFESALHELEPVERALNGCVDALRREDIKGREMAEELQRSIAVMSHLASLHIKEGLASQADDLLMRTMVLQSRLESATTALQLSRSMIETNLSHPIEEDEDEEDDGHASDLALILGRADTLINHTRNAKVMVGKTYRALTDLQARSLTLETTYTSDFEKADDIAVQIASYTFQAGDALQAHFTDQTKIEALTPSQISQVLSQTAVTVFLLEAPEAGPYNALARQISNLTDVIADLTALPNDLDNTVEFERGSAPWVARANELKQTKITSIDTEAELSRTLEALRGQDGVIRDKDTELEEQSVRIEMLEARLKDASRRSARIGELEKALYEAKDAERKARSEMQRTKEEKDREIERAREEMGRLGEERRGALGGQLQDGAMGAGARMAMKRQAHKLVALEGAVRYLKEENHRLRLPSSDSPLSTQATLSWLHEPLVYPKTERRKQQEALQKEGKDVLQKLLSLATAPATIDLANMPENKLAWKPIKDNSRWKVEMKKEEWETWKDWRRDVVKQGRRSA